MKYVINKKYGGFGLSDEAMEILIKEKGWTVTEYNNKGGYKNPNAKIVNTNPESKFGKKYSLIGGRYSLELRCNVDLVEVVEKLGDKANGRYANLKIVSAPYTPEDNRLEIDEYDGYETLQTISERFE